MNRKEFFRLATKGILGGSMLMMGCSNLLDQDNPNTLTPGSFYNDASEAEAAVTSVYQIFSGQAGWAQGNNVWWREQTFFMMSDTHDITNDVPANIEQANFTFTPANGNISALWNLNYTGIFRANQAIINIPKVTKIDTDLQERLMGEAKFLRAYFYFSLITAWREVPLRLTLPESNADYPMAAASREETWAQIEKDLQDAVSALPWTYAADNRARITKGAALTYLGKTYLYQQKWQQASDTFQQVIDSGNYSLMDNFWDVFKEQNDFNQESVLETNYSVDTFSGVAFKSFRNYLEAPSEVGGWDQYFPSPFVLQELSKEQTVNNELDPRVNGTLVWNGGNELYWGKSHEEIFGPNADDLYWKKYSSAETGQNVTDGNGKNWRILRYADVLLMHAEALTQLDRSSDAIPYVNQVRNRADLSDLPASMSKNDLLEEIEHQRICELADEGGYRWFDLVRWGGNITGTMNMKEVLQAHGHKGASNFVVGKNEYYPIPLSEMQTNPEIEQYPGW